MPPLIWSAAISIDEELGELIYFKGTNSAVFKVASICVRVQLLDERIASEHATLEPHVMANFPIRFRVRNWWFRLQPWNHFIMLKNIQRNANANSGKKLRMC